MIEQRVQQWTASSQLVDAANRPLLLLLLLLLMMMMMMM